MRHTIAAEQSPELEICPFYHDGSMYMGACHFAIWSLNLRQVLVCRWGR